MLDAKDVDSSTPPFPDHRFVMFILDLGTMESNVPALNGKQLALQTILVLSRQWDAIEIIYVRV